MISNTFNTLRNSRNPVTLQCVCYDQNSIPEFTKLLNLLSRYGFHGIELNLPDLTAMPAGELHSLLRTYDLALTYIATGVYARSRGLSLSAADPQLRRKSLEGCKENIRYAGDFGAGIIIGYLKNQPAPDCTPADRADAVQYLQESLAILDDFARAQNVPILLEATNRYESCVANSLADTWQTARGAAGYMAHSMAAQASAASAEKAAAGHPASPMAAQTSAGSAGKKAAGASMISILPDTYHMNIEESRPLEALELYQGCYRNVHLSDNNRYFPGLGCLAFENYLGKLSEIHYQGTFGIEGVLKNGIEEDLDVSVNYLCHVMESVALTREMGLLA